MIVDVYEGDTEEVLPVTRDELGNLALSSELCGMRGDCNDLATVRVATCHNKCGADTERSFTCSECGYEAWTFGVSFCEPDEFEFCPHCGRKVVRDDN